MQDSPGGRRDGGALVKGHRQRPHRQPDMKEALPCSISLPSLLFRFRMSRLLFMAEPRIRAEQHEHVEAESENRLHGEAVISPQAVSRSQYLIPGSAAPDWLHVKIYQPYIVTSPLVGGCVVVASDVPGRGTCTCVVTQELEQRPAGWQQHYAHLWPVVRVGVHSQISGRFDSRS